MRPRLIIFHTVLAVAFISLWVGSVQSRQYETVLMSNGSETPLVVNNDGKTYKMPFTMQLQNLQVERYSSGKPKSVTANVICRKYKAQSTQNEVTLSINHPVCYEHYQFYIQKYWMSDTYQNGGVQLQLVRQPAQIVVYAALLVLLILLAYDIVIKDIKKINQKNGVAILLVSVIILLIIIELNPMMQNLEFPPILRSGWFVPHIIAYVLAYALLLTGFVWSVMFSIHPTHRRKLLVLKCFQAGTLLFFIGLILGMLWAKAAWGTFWSWDPKETFALLTLLIDVGYLHYFSFRPISTKINCIWQTIGFLSLQMCWYGVQLLGLGGLHVY